MDVALIALIGTLCGGAGLKIVEHLLGRGSKKEDLASSLRSELRQDLANLKADLREESKAADEWQQKYWELKASTLIANSKADRLIEVVDEKHPDKHLKKDLEPLLKPDR